MAKERESRGGDGGLEDYVVKIRRCAAVVKGGRRFSFNALVVVGDKGGRVAYGYGKANEVPPAVEKAAKDAQETLKRQRKVQLKGQTIPHRVVGRYGSSRVVLVPAGPGSGHGKTASRGAKGQFASAGAGHPSWTFEGGQMPLFRRIPKRGFSHASWDRTYHIVNVGDLDKAFDAGATVDADALAKVGLAK